MFVYRIMATSELAIYKKGGTVRSICGWSNASMSDGRVCFGPIGHLIDWQQKVVIDTVFETINTSEKRCIAIFDIPKRRLQRGAGFYDVRDYVDRLKKGWDDIVRPVPEFYTESYSKKTARLIRVYEFTKETTADEVWEFLWQF